MKKNKISLLLVTCIMVLTFTNCDDITSENNTRTASFVTLEELASGRLPSLYANLRSRSLFSQAGIPASWSDAGIDTHGGTLFPQEFNPIYNYTYDSGTIIIEQTWAEFYKSIKNANAFIGQVNAASGDDTLRESLIGQARFIRAMLYFEMVKIWGDVPLIVSEDISLDTVLEDSEAPNAEAEDIYLQVISDLEYAKANLPFKSGSADVASGAAAQTLLGKVYLQMTTSTAFGGVEGGVDASGNAVSVNTRFEQAKAELTGILGQYELETNYSDVFSVEAENANSEVIFAVGFEAGPQTGSDWGDWIGPWGNCRHGGCFSAYPINISFAFQYLIPDGLVSATEFFTSTNASLDPDLYPLPNYTDGFFNDTTIRLSNELLLLGIENFVSDVRFEHNVARFHAQNLVELADGTQASNPLAIFNSQEVLTVRWQPWKFHKPNPNPNQGGQGDIDFPYLRYADVLLLMAEIENELIGPGAAVPYVEEVALRPLKSEVLNAIPDLTGTGVSYIVPTVDTPGTSRSELQPFIDSNLESVDTNLFMVTPEESSSKEAMLDRILLERAKELCFEGKRKDDLIRTGKFTEVVNSIKFGQVFNSVATDNIKLNYDQAKHVHWPIPFRELSLNPNLKQNCAYANSGGECF